MGHIRQLGALCHFFGLCRFIVGGKGVGLLAQIVELSLHDVEALALRHLLGLCRFIVAGKR